MRPDDGTGVLTRSLDELADIAVRRGDHLRRRRRQLRVVPVAALAVVVLVGVLRLGDDGSLTSVDIQPADRAEEDLAAEETREVDSGEDKSTGSTGSDVEAGAGPAAGQPNIAASPNARPDEVVGRTEVGSPHVLYVSGPGDQPALWQFDRQSGAHVRRDDADLCRPAALADGTIAYCKQGAIVVRDADAGGDNRVVVSNATDPDFSPDGERLAYVDRSTGGSFIWTVGIDGSDPRQLTGGPSDDRFPTWSPDGSQLAFVRGGSVSRSVWIAAADGSNAREVSIRFDGLDAYPLDWSPDGRLLAFTCVPSPAHRPVVEVPEAAFDTGVCFLDVATGEWEGVTPNSLQATSPAWSPDGSEIAFTAHPGTTAATSEVWVMRGDGTGERQLWPDDSGGSPAWYPVFLPARPSTTS